MALEYTMIHVSCSFDVVEEKGAFWLLFKQLWFTLFSLADFEYFAKNMKCNTKYHTKVC